MRVMMKKDGKDVAEMTFTPHTGWLEVYDLYVFDSDEIPHSWQLINRLDTENDRILFLENWVKQRMIPDYRLNIDAYIRNVLQLNDPGFGRMHSWQNIISTLFGFVSPFDQYRIVPKNEKVLYFGTEDERVEKVYELNEWVDVSKMEMVFKDNLISRRGLFGKWNETPVYSPLNACIPSQVPSWIKEEDGRIYLLQEVGAVQKEYIEGISAETKTWKHRVELYGDCTRVDITDIFHCGEIMWLQELIPYLQKGEKLEEQIQDLCDRVLSSKDEVSEIFELWNIMKDCGRELSLRECAITKIGDKLYPLVII